MHLHGAIAILCVSWLCRLHGIYERQCIEQKSLPTTQPCTAPWMSFTATPSTMLIQGPCHCLISFSSCSHRLKPLLQLFPLQPCITTQASTAGSLSTWPNPGSNKNQQINLECAILSLKEPCMHLYFSPFRYGETCFSISLLDCGGHWKHQYLGEGARKDETTGSHVCSSLGYF